MRSKYVLEMTGMLNEFSEYDIYLDLNEMSNLFRPENLRDALSGLHRPLLILARGFLGLCQKEDMNLSQSVSFCKTFLMVWLGGEVTECSSGMPEAVCREIGRAANNSFARYIEQMRTTTAISEEVISKILERLLWKRNDFLHSPFSVYALNHENDAHRIYSDQILADAMVKGPLKRRYLAISDLRNASAVCANDTQWKLCRAMICWYLQERSETQQYVVVTMSEISNWIDTPATSKGRGRNGKLRPCLTGVFTESPPYYNGNPLLYKSKLMGNTVKLMVDPQWLEDYQVCLITKDQIRDYAEKGFTIYDDSLLSKDKGLKIH